MLEHAPLLVRDESSVPFIFHNRPECDAGSSQCGCMCSGNCVASPQSNYVYSPNGAACTSSVSDDASVCSASFTSVWLNQTETCTSSEGLCLVTNEPPEVNSIDSNSDLAQCCPFESCAECDANGCTACVVPDTHVGVINPLRPINGHCPNVKSEIQLYVLLLFYVLLFEKNN